MRTKELIKILETYPANSTVSVVFPVEGYPCIEEVEMVAKNGGPSIYVTGWDSAETKD